MGRYAYFHSTNKTKAPEAETIHYKFWFACQSSEIPWARDSIQYFINDYDEDHGLDLTPEQDAWWQEHADDYYPGPYSLPNDILEILDDIGHKQYVAEDDDSDLDEYWDQRDTLAKRLGIDWSPTKEKSLQDNMEDFGNYLWNHYLEKHPDGEHTDEERRYADLALMTVICYFLDKHGSYECHYEC